MPRATRPMPETAETDTASQQAAADRGARRRPASERELAVLPAPEPGRVKAARSRLTGRFAVDGDAMPRVRAGRPLLDLRAISAVLEAAQARNSHSGHAPPEDGRARHAPAAAGLAQDAPAQDGPAQDGSAQDGPVRHTLAADGQAPHTPAADGQAHGGHPGEDRIGALDLGAALIVLAALRLDIDRIEADLMDEALRADLDQEFIASALGIPVPQAMKRHRLLGERRNYPVDQVPDPAAPSAARHP